MRLSVRRVSTSRSGAIWMIDLMTQFSRTSSERLRLEMMPTLIVQGIHDKQVNPERAKELYADLGATEKVLVDLGCASHNAMWEKAAHTLLFNASLEWLEKGTVNGMKSGIIKMGY